MEKNPNQEKFFKEAYTQTVNEGAVGVVSNILHKLLEFGMTSDYKKNYVFRIVEMGAGQGQHYKYVKQNHSEYIEIDIRPKEEIRNIESPQNYFKQDNSKRTFLQSDCSSLQGFEDDSIDRIIATCLLVHLTDPEKALNEWRRIAKPGGKLSLWVALEPSLLLRLLQKITTKRKYKKLGYEYEAIHYREHIQHYPRMRMLIQEIFAKDKVQSLRFPFPFLWWHMNLVEIYQIQVADKKHYT